LVLAPWGRRLGGHEPPAGRGVRYGYLTHQRAGVDGKRRTLD
jgi:hypothetical protein